MGHTHTYNTLKIILKHSHTTHMPQNTHTHSHTHKHTHTHSHTTHTHTHTHTHAHTQSKDFGIYLKYCKNKPTSDTAKTEHEPYFNQRQTDLATDGRLTIDDLLIAPVQRFTKYQLLMRVGVCVCVCVLV